MSNQIIFEQLNIGWNAEPNAPELEIVVKGTDIIICFYLDFFTYGNFSEGDKVKITFHNCHQYRVGAPNDEGFYCYNQSRYKRYGVKWGDFYLVHNSDWQNNFPDPIKIGAVCANVQHYLFYFKDETFECIATSFEVEFYKKAR